MKVHWRPSYDRLLNFKTAHLQLPWVIFHVAFYTAHSLEDKIKYKLFDLSKDIKHPIKYFPTCCDFHTCLLHRHCFPCSHSDISVDVHVQWFTSAVDKHEARCLLQPAINCLVWHWVSMSLSTDAHIARYIKLWELWEVSMGKKTSGDAFFKSLI